MLPLKLPRQDGLKILCLGAHCDDIEIGCGGTVMRLSDEYTALKTKWGVFTFTSERGMEARKSADHFRHDLHQDHRLICDLTWTPSETTSFWNTKSQSMMATETKLKGAFIIEPKKTKTSVVFSQEPFCQKRI